MPAPLEGITLKTIVTELVEEYGWETLASTIPIRCFSHDPSISSSLHFLRRTPWARTRVENLYLEHLATEETEPSSRTPDRTDAGHED